MQRLGKQGVRKLHLGDVEAGSVNHRIANGAQSFKLAGCLQQLFKQRGVVLSAIYCNTHGLLAGPIHPVQALTPALNLILIHYWSGKDLGS